MLLEDQIKEIKKQNKNGATQIDALRVLKMLMNLHGSKPVKQGGGNGTLNNGRIVY